MTGKDAPLLAWTVAARAISLFKPNSALPSLDIGGSSARSEVQKGPIA
jgi:hypothetical protein